MSEALLLSRRVCGGVAAPPIINNPQTTTLCNKSTFTCNPFAAVGGSPLFAMQLAVHESTAWNLAASTARRLSPPISMKVNFHSVCASVATRCRFPCALYAQSYILTGTAGRGHYHQARTVGLSAFLASTIIIFLPIFQYFKGLFALRLGAWGGVAPVVWLKVLPPLAAPQAATIQ